MRCPSVHFVHLGLVLGASLTCLDVAASPVRPPINTVIHTIEQGSPQAPVERYDGLASAATFSLNPDADDGVFEYGGGHSSHVPEFPHHLPSQLYGHGLQPAMQMPAYGQGHDLYGHAQTISPFRQPYLFFSQDDDRYPTGFQREPLRRSEVAAVAPMDMSNDQPWWRGAGEVGQSSQGGEAAITTDGKNQRWTVPAKVVAVSRRWPRIPVHAEVEGLFEPQKTGTSAIKWIEATPEEREYVLTQFREYDPSANWHVKMPERYTNIRTLVHDRLTKKPDKNFGEPPFAPYIVNNNIIYFKGSWTRNSDTPAAPGHNYWYHVFGIPVDPNENLAHRGHAVRDFGSLGTNLVRHNSRLQLVQPSEETPQVG